MRSVQHIYKAFVVIFMVTIIFMTCGCVEEMEYDIIETEYLSFTTRFSEEATKATPMTKLDKTTTKVIGYIYEEWPEKDMISTFAPWPSLANMTYRFDGDQMVSADEADMVKWSSFPTGNEEMLKVYAELVPDLNS